MNKSLKTLINKTNQDKILKILSFNTDKDKLEVEIRKEMIARIIDG
mgnify:CR=1 FL=1